MADYPTTSTSALIDVFKHRATSPFSISLGLGFAASSYFLFQNVDTLTWSPVALVGSSKERRKVGLEGNQGQAVELWEWYMKKAVPTTGISLAVGTLGLASAGFLIPVSSFSTYPRDLRRILFGAVLVLASTVPYSLFSITPLNKTLLSLSQKSAAKRANPLYPDANNKPASADLYTKEARGLLPQEENQAKLLLEKWIKAHTGRVVLAAAGWTLALGGLMLAY